MKEIPEGMWLLLALAETDEDFANLEKKYGKLGGGTGDVSIHDLRAIDIEILQAAVRMSMHTIGKETRDKWDPQLVNHLYKHDEFENDRNPKEKAIDSLLDYLNTGLRFEEVIVQAEWEGAGIILKPLTRTLIAKAWVQLFDAMTDPIPWKICEYCRNPFPIRRKGAVYCSDSCRAGAYKKRKGILK
ncbi:hypothetical protein [Candidatus Thiodiazotropha sp. CDECU1]|uniref:hypothetical protein n=1 Tax=Candidatus Thiodiazotropha sp. CDECU1 TaxID=3065865 RepID=UPI00292D8044|nr:hypothetical protein [Candidatus Thiodiazotropha sp. CDECU1]